MQILIYSLQNSKILYHYIIQVFCIIQQPKGVIFMTWKAMTKDGKEILEGQASWTSIKNNIKQLALTIPNGPTILLPKNMEEYFHAKTASAELGGTGKDITIESRYIGFKIGNNIVRIRVNEKTQNITVEVE
jgi:hypothetical protein